MKLSSLITTLCIRLHCIHRGCFISYLQEQSLNPFTTHSQLGYSKTFFLNMVFPSLYLNPASILLLLKQEQPQDNFYLLLFNQLIIQCLTLDSPLLTWEACHTHNNSNLLNFTINYNRLFLNTCSRTITINLKALTVANLKVCHQLGSNLHKVINNRINNQSSTMATMNQRIDKSVLNEFLIFHKNKED